MKRWLFRILVLLSLILFVGVGALWIKSVYYLADSAGYGWYEPGASTFHYLEMNSCQGRISFGGNDYFYDHTKVLVEGKRLGSPEYWPAGWIWSANMTPDFPPWPWRFSTAPSLLARIGFDWYRVDLALALDTRRYWGLVLPDWFLMLVLLILPGAWVRGLPGRRRRFRLARGLCTACGYDLRVHKPGDKCPECGTVMTARVLS
jgi:hypothetical protein